MPNPRTIVLRAAGSNCDYETAFAFEQVGADVDLVHVNRLVAGDINLDDYQVLAIPGGFTYGDDIAAGKILANEFKNKLGADLKRFHADGKLIIGICNGFQVLAKAGLLPVVDLDAKQQITLTDNDSGKFEDRWVYLSVEDSVCVFTHNIPAIVYFPVAHAEGKFVTREQRMLKELYDNRQIVFRYVDQNGNEAGYPWNPNGSLLGIAGVCDSSGRVLGMMPHPERHFDPTHHPRWTREGLKAKGDGVVIFRNAMEYVKNEL